jgi:hypothetical protein
LENAKMNRIPQLPKPGDRVTVDPTTADEEVVPPTSEDIDQGRDTQEPKEPPQREQIFPIN